MVMSMVLKRDEKYVQAVARRMGANLLASVSVLQNDLKIESISKTTSRDTKPRSLPAKVRIQLRASLIN